MRWLMVGTLLIGVLTGCEKAKEEALSDCRFQVSKVFPGIDLSQFSIAPTEVRQMVQACMEGKGYGRDASSSSCSLMNVELQAACYK